MAASNKSPAFIGVDGGDLPHVFAVEIKWVTPRLAIGSMIGTAPNMRAVAAAGITHVINVQAEFDDSAIVGDTGIHVHWLKVESKRGFAETDLMELALRFAEEALHSPDNAILVHCLAGRSRSPKVAYAILLRLGFSKTDACNLIRKVEKDAMLEEDVLHTVSDCSAR